MKTKTKIKTEKTFFTDEMHKDIFPFQPSIGSRGYNVKKPIPSPNFIKISVKR